MLMLMFIRISREMKFFLRKTTTTTTTAKWTGFYLNFFSFSASYVLLSWCFDKIWESGNANEQEGIKSHHLSNQIRSFTVSLSSEPTVAVFLILYQDSREMMLILKCSKYYLIIRNTQCFSLSFFQRIQNLLSSFYSKFF